MMQLSLHIRGGDKPEAIIKFLETEINIAKNIKSQDQRFNVINCLRSAIHTINIKYKEKGFPENGLLITKDGVVEPSVLITTGIFMIEEVKAHTMKIF